MNRFPVVMFSFLLFLFVFPANAQTKTGAEYFAGSWSVLLKGLPQGDALMLFNLEKKDSTITGTIKDSTGTEISKVDKAEITENSITLYFTAQGYDVNLVLNRKDDDHVTGSLMSMFDAEGERKKENAATKK